MGQQPIWLLPCSPFFTVPVGFVVVLPLLPYLIERLQPQLQMIECNE